MAVVSPAPTENPFRYVYSEALAELLERTGSSLLVSTYQAGKLVVARSVRGRASMLLRSFDQPMGIAVGPDRVAVGTKNQIWLLRNAAGVMDNPQATVAQDACYVPRTCHVTGDVRVHELAWCGEELWFVNTRFSCLCTLDERYSFVPRWRPPFVTDLAAEDRCHLNGLAVAESQPKYVTALGATDMPEGWRPSKAEGGVVVDVPSGDVVGGGFSMPHSPRVHGGRLWLLDSGRGRFGVLDPSTGKFESVAELPGYTRGLTFLENYALVGLSSIRETAMFSGLPISERQKELRCGVWAVEIDSGKSFPLLDFERGVEEIFSVEVVPYQFPGMIGFQKDTIDHVYDFPSAD